jgi:hypothetical protein
VIYQQWPAMGLKWACEQGLKSCGHGAATTSMVNKHFALLPANDFTG